MPQSTWTGRARWALGFALAYALVILVAPAFHDASDCLGGSREHCAACLASPPATQLEPEAVLGGPDLVPAERAEPAVEASAGTLLPAATPGRAPPE
jgi:hypothetical protein